MNDRPYILYAEDDEDDVHFFREFLPSADAGKDVIYVKDGFSVIDHLQNVKKGQPYPALIILDILMPRLSGIDTLDLLKTDDLYRLIPVIMFTTTSNKSDDEFCTRLGVDIISKPVSYTHWDPIIKRICSYCD
jgi:two-component system, response regulator